MLYNEIGLCAQSTLTILSSTVNIVCRAYVIV